MIKSLCSVILFSLLFLSGISSFCQPTDSTFVIKESKDFFALNKVSYLLKDKEAKLKIDDVLKSSAGFQPLTEEIYNFRNNKNVKAFWLKCNFQNLTGNSLHDLLCFHPGVDTVEVFIYNPDGTFNSATLRSSQLASSRPVYISQVLSIPISLQKGITKVYVRFANQSKWSREMGSIIFSMAEEKSFLNYFLEVRFYQGLMLGMILLILVFHIFIYIFFRDTTYLIFLINVVFTLLYLFLRKNFQLEFDFLSPFNSALNYLHDPFGVLISLTAIWFSQSFLNTRNEDPVLHKVMNILKVILGMVAISSLSLQLLTLMNMLAILLGFISALIVIVASVRSYLRGNKLALYVFFGFLLLAIIPVIYLIPIPNYLHFRTSESDFHYFGEAVRSIIFAVGITDRFYQLKKEVARMEVEKEQLKFEKERQMKEEKERISHELHDNIGSQLVVLSLELGNPDLHKTEDPEIMAARQRINTIINQLRDTVWVLENDNVTIKGLEGKVNMMMFLYRKKIYGFDFTLKVPDDIKSFSFKPSQANHVYRIIQGAVQNAVQHSKGKTIDVIFSFEPLTGILTITITDDGQGFDLDVSDLDGDTHYGIKNMRKRASDLNGTLEIISWPSGGTTASLSFPIS